MLTPILLHPGADCSRRYDVVNRGFSGYNTSQALKILEQVFPERTADGPKMKYLVGSSPRSRHNPSDAHKRLF